MKLYSSITVDSGTIALNFNKVTQSSLRVNAHSLLIADGKDR